MLASFQKKTSAILLAAVAGAAAAQQPAMSKVEFYYHIGGYKQGDEKNSSRPVVEGEEIRFNTNLDRLCPPRDTHTSEELRIEKQVKSCDGDGATTKRIYTGVASSAVQPVWIKFQCKYREVSGMVEQWAGDGRFHTGNPAYPGQGGGVYLVPASFESKYKSCRKDPKILNVGWAEEKETVTEKKTVIKGECWQVVAPDERRKCGKNGVSGVMEYPSTLPGFSE